MSTRWTLSQGMTEALLDVPETGMGFQFVEGKINHARVYLLVFNAEIAYDVTDLQLSDQRDLATVLDNGARLSQAMRNAQERGGTLTLSEFSAAPPRVGGGGTPPSPPSAAGASVAPPSSLVNTYSLTANRMFYRFSAYSPDKRVNPLNGDFLAGTYATTDSDHSLVTSGFAAVGRYALPNIRSAFHRYRLEAPSGTTVTTGTVAPAFSQSGGGVEALFTTAVNNAQSPAVMTLIPED